MLELDQAYDLVRELSRTRNYPRNDEAGELSLARGLQRAARDFEQAKAIVRRCAELSEYCPTDHDMLTVAGELAPPVESPGWQPFTGVCSRGRCDGRGWAQVWFLVTEETRGNSNYKRRERITFDQYRALVGKVDGRTQRVYESVERCPCAAPVEARQLAAGDKNAD